MIKMKFRWRIFISVVLLLPFIFLAGCGDSGGKPSTVQMGGAIQGRALNLVASATTLAGLRQNTESGIFRNPNAITSDGENLYITDTGNNAIRKVVIATGEVSTLAGGTSGARDGIGTAAQFNNPLGITNDGVNLYVTEWGNTIRKIVIATGAVTTVAGITDVSGTTDGPPSTARFNGPTAITTDGSNLYVYDSLSYTIRKVVIATGEVSTLAGSPGVTGFVDGTGPAATLGTVGGMATDGTSLYVADISSEGIRKVVIATGEVTTLTWSGDAWGITIDGGDLYLSCLDRTVRKFSNGALTTIAGDSGKPGAIVDGIGSAARFLYPLAIVSVGPNLYVLDYYGAVRKVVKATGSVTSVIGSEGSIGSTDGPGAAARFNFPHGVTSDGNNIYVADGNNGAIRKIALSTGVVSTLAGSADNDKDIVDGQCAAASFLELRGITTDGRSVYVTDANTVRKVEIATGLVTTIAGADGAWGAADGTGSAARFDLPTGITTDGSNLYVIDSNNFTIRKIVIATGEVTTLAGRAGASGSADGFGSSARFSDRARSITTDGKNLYVGDGFALRRVVIATGQVSTIAGNSDEWGQTDGRGSAARFVAIEGITSDGRHLYLSDGVSIRKVDIETGVVTTLLSTGDPQWGITTDGRSLYIVDDSNTIQMVH